jgi:hypothetical protein
MEGTYPRPVILWHWLKTLRERRRHDVSLAKTLEIIRREHRRAMEARLEHYARFYNVALYLLVFERDFTVLKWDGLHATESWKRNLTTRLIGVMVYEAAEDLSQLLGQDFREMLSRFPVDEEQRDSFDCLKRELSRFFKTNRVFLKDMRNFVAAHRDHDASKQLDVIEGIEFARTIGVAGDLYLIIRELTKFLIHVTKVGGRTHVLLDHLFAREEQK